MAVSRGSDRRLSTAEETEEEEDRLQKKRVELLQRQFSEDGVQPGVSSSPAKAERRRSSGSSFNYRPSMPPSVGTPPQRPNPIDSLVDHFGPSESSSYFPTLTSPPGLVAGAQVTVSSSLPQGDVFRLTLDSVCFAGGHGGVPTSNTGRGRASKGVRDRIRQGRRQLLATLSSSFHQQSKNVRQQSEDEPADGLRGG